MSNLIQETVQYLSEKKFTGVHDNPTKALRSIMDRLENANEEIAMAMEHVDDDLTFLDVDPKKVFSDLKKIEKQLDVLHKQNKSALAKKSTQRS